MTIGKNRLRFYIIDALVLGIFSLIAFLVPFEHTTAFWLSYAFGAVAILLQIYVYPRAFAAPGAKSKVYGFPAARVSTVYLAAQLVLSLIFMQVGDGVKTWVVWLIDLVLLAFALIGLITVDVAQDEVTRQETAMKKDTTAMKAMRAKVAALNAAYSGAGKAALDRLNEDFISSDPVSSDATQALESRLAVRLEDLAEAIEKGREDQVEDLCRKISATLTERNTLCRASKNG